jgi:uncharacterized protein (DUF4415 family)
MNRKSTGSSSQSDWAAFDALTEEDIDTTEIPPLDASFFAQAELRLPRTKPAITIRLDPDVLEWFKSQGKGYQTRINAILRMYMEAQQR